MTDQRTVTPEIQESNEIAWDLDGTCNPMLSTLLKLGSALPGELVQQLAFSAPGSTSPFTVAVFRRSHPPVPANTLPVTRPSTPRFTMLVAPTLPVTITRSANDVELLGHMVKSDKCSVIAELATRAEDERPSFGVSDTLQETRQASTHGTMSALWYRSLMVLCSPVDSVVTNANGAWDKESRMCPIFESEYVISRGEAVRRVALSKARTGGRLQRSATPTGGASDQSRVRMLIE